MFSCRNRPLLKSFLFGFLDIMHYSNMKGSLAYRKRHISASRWVADHSPSHDPSLHPFFVNIFTLSISFQSIPQSPHIISSSNRMYIENQDSTPRTKALLALTSVPPNESKPSVVRSYSHHGSRFLVHVHFLSSRCMHSREIDEEEIKTQVEANDEEGYRNKIPEDS
jgi:hypothetical protein